MSAAADCVMKQQEAASALHRQSNQPVMCVRERLSATTLCWAARPVSALQLASKTMQGVTVIVSVDSAGEWKHTLDKAMFFLRLDNFY